MIQAIYITVCFYGWETKGHKIISSYGWWLFWMSVWGLLVGDAKDWTRSFCVQSKSSRFAPFLVVHKASAPKWNGYVKLLRRVMLLLFCQLWCHSYHVHHQCDPQPCSDTTAFQDPSDLSDRCAPISSCAAPFPLGEEQSCFSESNSGQLKPNTSLLDGWWTHQRLCKGKGINNFSDGALTAKSHQKQYIMSSSPWK